MMYRVCPHCGANLDPNEKCDCQEKKASTVTPQERVKQAVYATGNRWAIENFNLTH